MILLDVDLLISVQVSTKKKFILNLNNYRNAHYRTLSKAKLLYTDELVSRIRHCAKIKEKPLTLEYTYYAKSKRRFDVSNPLSVIDKFTQDAIVKAGILTDDNSKIIDTVIFKNGNIDRENPRANLKIYCS